MKAYAQAQATAQELRVAAMAWEQAKEEEKQAIQRRRDIEDYLKEISLALNDDFEGSALFDAEDYDIKVVGRLTRKVDEDRLRELTREYDLDDIVPALFRFKAELKLSAWKNASAEITQKLAPAIETKPGRPSFEIIKKGE